VLEKVAADYADKGVLLAKIDVDKNPFIAAQFQVRSIPTVYAMFQSQLVADLSQARTETQIRTMLDQILKQLPIEASGGEPQGPTEEELAPLFEMAEEILAAGEAERALSIFDQIGEMAPAHPMVAAGRARSLLALDRIGEAEIALADLPEEVSKSPEVERARAAIALVRDAKPVEDISGLAAHAAANPEDMEARFELAGGQMAANDRDAAADTLLAMIADDRAWNEGAAKQRLLTLFEAVGLEDPWVSAQRRRLSAILFG
jgi:putative thioredoxin